MIYWEYIAFKTIEYGEYTSIKYLKEHQDGSDNKPTYHQAWNQTKAWPPECKWQRDNQSQGYSE